MTAPDDYREEGSFGVILDGERLCVPRFCPHRGGRLAHGAVNAGRRTISCPLHRSVFSLETGEQLAGPACGPLAIASPGSAGARSDGKRRGESIASPGSAGARSDGKRCGESIAPGGAPCR